MCAELQAALSVPRVTLLDGVAVHSDGSKRIGLEMTRVLLESV